MSECKEHSGNHYMEHNKQNRGYHLEDICWKQISEIFIPKPRKANLGNVLLFLGRSTYQCEAWARELTQRPVRMVIWLFPVELNYTALDPEYIYWVLLRYGRRRGNKSWKYFKTHKNNNEPPNLRQKMGSEHTRGEMHKVYTPMG